MCLVIAKGTLVAEEDIVCYKVISYRKLTDTYYSPFTGTFIHRECITEGQHFIAQGDKTVKMGADGNTVSDGFIHTYENFQSAAMLAYLLDKHKFDEFVLKVYKCIIPKGTRYFYGEDESTDGWGYASDKIVFKEEIEY